MNCLKFLLKFEEKCLSTVASIFLKFILNLMLNYRSVANKFAIFSNAYVHRIKRKSPNILSKPKLYSSLNNSNSKVRQKILENSLIKFSSLNLEWPFLIKT